MKSIFQYFIIFIGLLGFPTPAAKAANPQEQAAAALIARVLPRKSPLFECEIIPPAADRDIFEIESKDGKIILRGNNGTSIASALNWYLKYHCHSDISWCGDQIDLPNPLPLLKEKIRKTSPHEYRYAFNYCTYGYTMAFWDWPRWEREIDLMALHGINTPLMATGAEVVYRNVYRDLGFSDKEIGDFIAAPPFLPWFLMGNIDGWGGPNPAEWYDRQEALQKKIMARAMNLGMKPVLPAFSGHVPATLTSRFPDARISKLKSWSGFPGVNVLDPSDPLFRDIGSRFVKESTKLYGTAHLYSADTFNEVDPPTDDPDYLRSMTRQVYQSMADADSEAVWFMQGWLFVHSKFWTQPRIEALLSGAADDEMVILDLFADGKPQWKRTGAFAGKPWLWCIINNWGGKQGMYGRLNQVGVEMPKLINRMDAGSLSGIGSVNEGGENNPIVYEQLYEMAWRDKPLDLDAWVDQFAWSRYGVKNESARKAWRILADTLYECRDLRHGPQGNFLAMPPSLSKDGGGFARGKIFYDTGKVREAFRLLLDAADELGNKDTYRYDLVDIARQVISDIAQQQLHTELREAFDAKDARRFKQAADTYCEAIQDCDKLLSSHTLFQFGQQLQYPVTASKSAAGRTKWERNFRRLITLWGGPKNSLFGYAQRQYGGLMRDYNFRCWRLYLDAARKTLRDGTAPPSDGGVREFTEKWIHEQKRYPVHAEADPIASARMIWEKYASKAPKVGAPDDPLDIEDVE